MLDLLMHVANGSLEGAQPRVVDVAVILSDGTLASGYASKVSLGQGSALVLTAQGSVPGFGDDTPIDLADVVWGWATADDGSQKTFGTPAEELEPVLGDALEEAKKSDPRGADVARIEVALGAVAHAKGDLREASRRYRGAAGKIVMGGDERAIGDIWMRIAGVHAEMGDKETLREAVQQALTAYTVAYGDEHPRVVHTLGVLSRAGGA